MYYYKLKYCLCKWISGRLLFLIHMQFGKFSISANQLYTLFP